MYSLNLSWSRKLRFCKSSQVIGAQLSLSPSRFAPLRDGRTDGFDSLQAFHFSTPLLRIARCSSSDMVASVSVSRGRVRLTAFVCAQCTSSRGPRHRKGSLRRPGGFSRCPNRRSRDSWVIANARAAARSSGFDLDRQPGHRLGSPGVGGRFLTHLQSLRN
jgi:hypothetical protein